MKLVTDMLAGHRLSMARLISKMENRDSNVPTLMAELYPHTGKAQIWGITGPPGAGKSTLVDLMTAELRKKGKKVAVIAIDPSSPFTGGAVLGDRIRMQRHSGDPGVYIRSLGTRGQHGGLSLATQEVVLVLDAAGFDIILVETAGVGQTELDILRLAQSIIVILVPESGDSIQVMKAGLMEIADLFVINKCDRIGADILSKELVTMIGMAPSNNHPWVVPVLKTDGSRNQGITELVQSVEKHQHYLTQSDQRKVKSQEFLKNEVVGILRERLNHSIKSAFETDSGQELLDKLLKREIDPYAVANLISV